MKILCLNLKFAVRNLGNPKCGAPQLVFNGLYLILNLHRDTV